MDATLIETHKRDALPCYKGFKTYQPTGCGFPALRGWASANDQAKTRECRLDAMIL